jgi:hypothetical protein
MIISSRYKLLPYAPSYTNVRYSWSEFKFRRKLIMIVFNVLSAVNIVVFWVMVKSSVLFGKELVCCLWQSFDLNCHWNEMLISWQHFFLSLLCTPRAALRTAYFSVDIFCSHIFSLCFWEHLILPCPTQFYHNIVARGTDRTVVIFGPNFLCWRNDVEVQADVLLCYFCYLLSF